MNDQVKSDEFLMKLSKLQATIAQQRYTPVIIGSRDGNNDVVRLFDIEGRTITRSATGNSAKVSVKPQ